MSPNAKIPAPNSTQTGSASTHASRRFRSVSFCRPEWFANMVPATPEESTWVVLTGRPIWSAAKMVAIATSSAEAPARTSGAPFRSFHQQSLRFASADHGAKAQRHRNRNPHPDQNEFRDVVHMGLQRCNGLLLCRVVQLLLFDQFALRFRGQVQVSS